MARNLKNQKGFTLVEVLISMVILGIVVFSFLNLFGTSFVNIYSMGTKDRAMAKASDIMDILYREQGNAGFDAIGTVRNVIANNFSGFNPGVDGDGNLTGNLFQNDASYQGNYKIKEINGHFEGAIPGYNVTIYVSYTASGEQSEITLTSFFRGRD